MTFANYNKNYKCVLTFPNYNKITNVFQVNYTQLTFSISTQLTFQHVKYTYFSIMLNILIEKKKVRVNNRVKIWHSNYSGKNRVIE